MEFNFRKESRKNMLRKRGMPDQRLNPSSKLYDPAYEGERAVRKDRHEYEVKEQKKKEKKRVYRPGHGLDYTVGGLSSLGDVGYRKKYGKKASKELKESRKEKKTNERKY